MHIEERRIGSVLVYEVSGAMDLYTLPELKDRFREAVAAGVRQVVVHMDRVDSLSSSGIGALISFQQELKRVSGQLALAQLSSSCLYVLQITKLTPLFQIFQSAEEAARALQS